VTFGHKMMYPAEPDWHVTSDDFADEDLASLLRGDDKKRIDFLASIHMLKLQCLTAKLGTTAWNNKSYMHVPDKAALGVLHSQIMAQEPWRPSWWSPWLSLATTLPSDVRPAH